MMSQMDTHGFLKGPVYCNQCKKELSGEGGPRPAETYVGTYTGLCYACEHGEPFIVETHFDGAITRSYPPHCPAWRRDREEFTGYPDCPECNGSGRKYISRSDREGGSYYSYCAPCLDKFCRNPIRKCFYESQDSGRMKIIAKFERLFAKQIKKAGLDLTNLTEDETQRARNIAEPLLTARHQETEAFMQKADKYYKEAQMMPTEKGVAHLKELKI